MLAVGIYASDLLQCSVAGLPRVDRGKTDLWMQCFCLPQTLFSDAEWARLQNSWVAGEGSSSSCEVISDVLLNIGFAFLGLCCKVAA
jgi:hypothetical protein